MRHDGQKRYFPTPSLMHSLRSLPVTVFMAKCNAVKTDTSNSHSTFCNSFRSYIDESDRAIAADQNLMMFAMILMVAYVAFVLARRDLVESKVSGSESRTWPKLVFVDVYGISENEIRSSSNPFQN